jgi:hypothetical protein
MSEQTLRQREGSNDVLLDSVLKSGLRAPAARAHRIPKIRGRAQEVAAMTTLRRWQDWVVVGLGALMFVTPFVFGETANSVAAYTACVLGALIALAGLLNGAMKDAGRLELIPAVVAVILFVSPWTFGFSAVTGLAGAAWIVAILVVFTVGSLFAMRNRRAMA